MRSTGSRLLAAAVVAGFVVTACTSTPKPHGGASSQAPTGGADSLSSALPPLSPSAAGTPPTPAQLPHIDEATLKVFYNQKLNWTDCNGFQCAKLTVPLDYAKPNGVTIQLAVIRKQTTAKAKLGSVVLNPGGPGGSGIKYAQAAASVIGSVLGGKFDVVSFDPRGVGQSAPIRCLSFEELDQWIAFEADPAQASAVAEQDALAKQFAAGCAAKSGSLLAHVSTVDTARDLDVLRAAIGDPKLTYIGASYGTFLGAIYAQLFPTHSRALVLDGALDPSASTSQLDHVQAQGFEVALHAYIASCTRSRNCPLGTSPDAAEPKLDNWLAGLRTAPLNGSNGRTLSQALAVQGVAAALYSPGSWADLTSALTSAFLGNPSGLLMLSDQIDGRKPDGSYDNLVESNTAINCVDRPGLGPSIDAYAREAASGKNDGATFGEFIDWGTIPCVAWPVAPELAPGPVSAAGAPPILVIGNLRDPATPYRWAQALAAQLAGPLLTVDADGHTAFLRSSCVNAVVKDYLVSLNTPPSGKVCK